MLALVPALLALALPASADTAEEESCRDWGVLPASITTSSGQAHTFRIDTLTECRPYLECVWSLSNAVGSLASDEGLNVEWNAPEEPPDACEPLDTSLVVSCTLWDSLTSTGSAAIQVRCTDAERQELEQQLTEDYSIGGGGCTSARQAQAVLLVLPIGLIGLRRRMRA